MDVLPPDEAQLLPAFRHLSGTVAADAGHARDVTCPGLGAGLAS